MSLTTRLHELTARLADVQRAILALEQLQRTENVSLAAATTNDEKKAKPGHRHHKP